MSARNYRIFLARDAYSVWKKRVQEAAHSVVVYTPYLDSMLGRLLGNSALDAQAITVVTDFSPASRS